MIKAIQFDGITDKFNKLPNLSDQNQNNKEKKNISKAATNKKR